eukprot:c5222_g1_i1.p1 GENE.c5222_g1_i1~~c5222_g1_i1.p1  ORF type:complete len:411 (-),score=84.54 c5222_g1_i1:147-1304(-)
MSASSSDIEYEPAVVIDNGTGSIKAGFAGDDAPKLVFPSVIGFPPDPANPGDLDAYYIGARATAMRERLELRYPLEHGIVENWDDMEKIWEHIFYEGLPDLETDSHPVLLTEAPLNPLKNREKMAEIMFEKFEVPALQIALQAVLALYANGRTTGIVLDVGDGVTHCMPVVEGFPFSRGMLRLNLAGRDLTKRLANMLLDKGFVFDSPSLLEIVKDMKAKHCRVAMDYDAEVAAGLEPQYYTLPDERQVPLNLEQISVAEALFNPSMTGMEKLTSPGIHQLIMSSIGKSDIDVRRDLYNNIILSGGSTMVTGLVERLEKELHALTPESIRCRVVAPPEREYSVWIGGAIMASLASMQWISKIEWLDEGPSILHRDNQDGRATGGR